MISEDSALFENSGLTKTMPNRQPFVNTYTDKYKETFDGLLSPFTTVNGLEGRNSLTDFSKLKIRIKMFDLTQSTTEIVVNTVTLLSLSSS